MKLECGLADEDVKNIKIFMRSFTDAIRCTEEIAHRDHKTQGYREHMGLLLSSLKDNKMMIDQDSKVVMSTFPEASEAYSMMKFVYQKYN